MAGPVAARLIDRLEKIDQAAQLLQDIRQETAQLLVTLSPREAV